MRLPNAMFLEHYVFFAYRRQPDETALDRRFLDPGRGRHLFPRGDTAPCDPTGLFPTHTDARSVARRRVGRSPHSTHAFDRGCPTAYSRISHPVARPEPTAQPHAIRAERFSANCTCQIGRAHV